MRLIYLLLLIVLGCNQTSNPEFFECIQNVKKINELPYIPELSGDSIYWEVVKGGLDIVPCLIQIISDSSVTNIPVPNFGGYYTLGDIAYFCITDIIKRIPTKTFVLKEAEENGFWYYWKFMREKQVNRIKFQHNVNIWYKENKNNLVWEMDTRQQKVAENWKFKHKRHPAGGYYVLKK